MVKQLYTGWRFDFYDVILDNDGDHNGYIIMANYGGNNNEQWKLECNGQWWYIRVYLHAREISLDRFKYDVFGLKRAAPDATFVLVKKCLPVILFVSRISDMVSFIEKGRLTNQWDDLLSGEFNEPSQEYWDTTSLLTI